jgi:hypothetical protein
MAIPDGHQLREAQIPTLINISLCAVMATLDGHQLSEPKFPPNSHTRQYLSLCSDGHPGWPSAGREQIHTLANISLCAVMATPDASTERG